VASVNYPPAMTTSTMTEIAGNERLRFRQCLINALNLTSFNMRGYQLIRTWQGDESISLKRHRCVSSCWVCDRFFLCVWPWKGRLGKCFDVWYVIILGCLDTSQCAPQKWEASPYQTPENETWLEYKSGVNFKILRKQGGFLHGIYVSCGVLIAKKRECFPVSDFCGVLFFLSMFVF
jgi:hypothetical protein